MRGMPADEILNLWSQAQPPAHDGWWPLLPLCTARCRATRHPARPYTCQSLTLHAAAGLWTAWDVRPAVAAASRKHRQGGTPVTLSVRGYPASQPTSARPYPTWLAAAPACTCKSRVASMQAVAGAGTTWFLERSRTPGLYYLRSAVRRLDC